MTPTYRTTGNSDAVFNRKPQTEGQRLTIYGKLELAARPEGEPHWLTGGLGIIALAVVALGVVLASGL